MAIADFWGIRYETAALLIDKKGAENIRSGLLRLKTAMGGTTKSAPPPNHSVCWGQQLWLIRTVRTRASTSNDDGGRGRDASVGNLIRTGYPKYGAWPEKCGFRSTQSAGARCARLSE